jgi:hypothetical protein
MGVAKFKSVIWEWKLCEREQRSVTSEASRDRPITQKHSILKILLGEVEVSRNRVATMALAKE